jgi:hypothetical protein
MSTYAGSLVLSGTITGSRLRLCDRRAITSAAGKVNARLPLGFGGLEQLKQGNKLCRIDPAQR